MARRTRALTVFGAALAAGAAVALGVDRLLELHLERQRPRVESESIFIALRSLPGGSAVTVWDVGIKPWPRAMVPATAIRSIDSFDGLVARHPLREGLPLLASQLSVDPTAGSRTESTRASVTAIPARDDRGGGDLWLPGDEQPPARSVASKAVPTPTDGPQSLQPEPPLPDPVPVAKAIVAPSHTPPAPSNEPQAVARLTVPATVSADIDPAPPTPRPTTEEPVGAESIAVRPAADVVAPPLPDAPTPEAGGEPIGDVAGTVLRPVLPGDWAPSTLRTIVVPQRIALSPDVRTAAAVAAAASALTPRQRPATAERTDAPQSPLRSTAAVPDDTARAQATGTRMVAARPSFAGRTPAAQGTTPVAPAGNAAAANAAAVRPLPQTNAARQPSAGRSKAPAASPARGFRLPGIFDWSR